MKKYNLLSYIPVVGVTIGLAFLVSCQGPAGPVGPQGAQGPQGEQGLQGDTGVAGVAGNMVCVECHNLTTMDSVTMQYERSVHGTSQAISGELLYQYAGTGDSRKECATCHTDQGFMEHVYTGLDTVATGLAIPERIQCESCHDFHKTLDQVNEGPDYAMRTMDAVPLRMYNNDSIIDLGNESNLCINCHQPLTAGPTPDNNGNAAVTSTHYGSHHGPQATILAGIGGYESFSNLVVPFPPSRSTTHYTKAKCVECHMYGDTINNHTHTFEPSLNACNTCHDHLTSFDFDGVQTSVTASMATLKAKLQAAGLLSASGSSVVGTFKVDQVGALYNYLMIQDDKSEGVHNAKYIEALLANSNAVFP